MGIIKILIIVTSVGSYHNQDLKTGLWLSELTHFYKSAKEQGYEMVIASPKGGKTPLDPESLKPLMLDKVSKGLMADSQFMEMLENTKSLDEIQGQHFDCIYLTGGHGTMYDFPHDAVLQHIVKEHYQDGKIIAAVCHGVSGLLNVRLSDGNYLIGGRKITGYSWFEETLAARRKAVPFNLEKELKKRTVYYKKAFFPLTSKVVKDKNLVTGQNPFSSKEIAKAVMQLLEKL